MSALGLCRSHYVKSNVDYSRWVHAESGNDASMNKAEEYLQRAAECEEMVTRAKTDIERQKLLQIAQAWRELARSGSASMPPDPEKKK